MSSRIVPASERSRHNESDRDERSPSLRELVRREWRAFRDAPPGERFARQWQRRRKPELAKLRAIAVAVGILLLAGGVVFLFIPGPGLLVIAFGLALLAGESRVLAGWLDRAEPALRRRHAAFRRWWGQARWPARAGIIGAGILLAASAVSLAAWWWFSR